MIFRNNQTLLFIGDSITDCGREYQTPTHLGYGYVREIASYLWAKYPELNLTVYNRGISGNTTKQLNDRWEEDCIALKPDFISILIGINDTWRRFDDAQTITTKDQFIQNCSDFLKTTKEKLPDTKILMLEPFLLPFPQDRITWAEDYNEKKEAIAELAKTYADYFVPLQDVFLKKAAISGFDRFAPDGVHPSDVGNMLIAQQFLSLAEIQS